MDTSSVVSALMQPRLKSCDEALSGADAAPLQPGVYGWYFRGLPELVPLEGSHEVDGHHLCYVGIAPSRAESSATLRSRIRHHCRGNASGSTLRRTLGSLLADELGLQMRRVGNSRRMHFHDGEVRLSDWMVRNARIFWLVIEAPWKVEPMVIQRLELPLNLQHNSGHPFVAELRGMRAEQMAMAKQLPVR